MSSYTGPGMWSGLTLYRTFAGRVKRPCAGGGVNRLNSSKICGVSGIWNDMNGNINLGGQKTSSITWCLDYDGKANFNNNFGST